MQQLNSKSGWINELKEQTKIIKEERKLVEQNTVVQTEKFIEEHPGAWKTVKNTIITKPIQRWKRLSTEDKQSKVATASLMGTGLIAAYYVFFVFERRNRKKKLEKKEEELAQWNAEWIAHDKMSKDESLDFD